MPLGYSARYVMYDSGTYWHLFQGSERVNGGLALSHDQAREDAFAAACKQGHLDHIPHAGLDVDLFMELHGFRASR